MAPPKENPGSATGGHHYNLVYLLYTLSCILLEIFRDEMIKNLVIYKDFRHSAGGTLSNPLIWCDATAKSSLLFKRNVYAHRLAKPTSMLKIMDCLTTGTVSQLGTFPYFYLGTFLQNLNNFLFSFLYRYFFQIYLN